MTKVHERISHEGVSRREFVGLAALTGATMSLGLTGCDNKLETTDASDVSSPTIEQLSGGEWKTFTCMQEACNWSCVNQAYVVDGIIKRQRTDQSHADDPDNPQQRGCIKGRSTRTFVTGVERLRYPMKRSSWQPGGGSNINGDLRGVDDWERISWDTAIDHIAKEFTRIKDTYGNKAFLTTQHAEDKFGNTRIGSEILNLMGGCLTTWGQQSQGGFPVVSLNMTGQWGNGRTEAQDRMAIRHSKLIVLWGFSSAWSVGPNDSYNFLVSKKKAGAKVIMIDPYLNPTAQLLADQWIPIRPSTDGALLEAIAHEIITNNWQDQDFLDRCCVGFDSEHMPADAKSDENFKDYILGLYDGQAKTAEWAAPITGVPVATIKELAREMASTKPMALKAALSVGRSHYGNRFGQLFFTVGWMTGNVGILGGEVAVSADTFGKKDGKCRLIRGDDLYERPTNPICTEPRAGGALTNGKWTSDQEIGLAYGEFLESIVTGQYVLPGPGGAKRDCDIKCIVRGGYGAGANQHVGGKYFEQAYRKVEFVVSQDLFMTNDVQYSDIVLPVKSYLEMELAYPERGSWNSDFCLVGTNVLGQFYETKDDAEILGLLCDALGFDESIAPRPNVKQSTYERMAATTIAKDDGKETEPLLTITQEDLDFYQVKGEPQQGRIPIQEFMSTGHYQFMRSEDDAHLNIFLESFRNDPVANPVNTTSGKLEIYCQKLKDWYDTAMMHDIDALPKYKAAVDGYEQITSDPDYRFQMVTPHQMRQAHTVYYNVRQINELFPNDLMMNENDAKELGLEKGDWALCSEKSGGQIARRINAVPNLMPGVVILGQGNWRKIDQETGIDIGGNVNSVTPRQVLGDGYQAYNTVLLKIEPYTGKEIPADYKRPMVVPIAEEA